MDLRRPVRRSAVLLFTIGLIVGLGLIWAVSRFTWAGLGQQLSSFTTVFLGITVDSVPFLFLGTLASGLVELFLPPQALQRLIPRGRLGGALAGAAMGLLLPVGECGTVPLARRLMRKGLPPPMAIAYLLAAPVINPIVLLSTAAAIGFSPILVLRFGLSLLIAVIGGLAFSVVGDPLLSLRRSDQAESNDAQERRVSQALVIAADEFTELGRYLVVGAGLAALVQAFLPRARFLALGSGPLLSVIAMLALAVALSINSTVDSFVALTFLGSFSPGSVLAFLVYGPMVDIKNALIYLGAFRRRIVIYLVALPLLLTLLAALLINLYLPL